MDRKNVRIAINVEYEALQDIMKFNRDNKLGYIDLNHLPFNQFDLKIKNKYEDQTEKDIEEAMEQVSSVVGLNEEEKRRILKDYVSELNNSAKNGLKELEIMSLHVKCINGVIDINVGNVARISLKTKANEIDFNKDPREYIEDVSMDMTSDRLSFFLSKSEGYKARFETFCLDNTAYVIHTLSYIQSSLNKEKENHHLYYEKRERIEKKYSKKSSKKGKKNKGQVSLIRNIEYSIDKSFAVRYIQDAPRKYERRTEEWYTRGFWRTYKSGKKVWIEPTIKRAKGSNNTGNKDINKTYVMK